MARKPPKPRRVKVRRISRPHEAYELLARVIAHWHPDLAEATIALCWYEWKPDKDGIKPVGEMRKASDLTKEFDDSEHDLVILLSEADWALLDASQKIAVLDHECEHATPALDSAGQPKVDERGRTVYRYRKHTIQDFHSVVSRHGCYMQHIQEFVKVARAAQKNGPRLFDAG